MSLIHFVFSVGVFKNGRVEIIPNDQGNRITPSYVAFTEDGERLIGDAAKNQLTSNPENTVSLTLLSCKYSSTACRFLWRTCPFQLSLTTFNPFLDLRRQTFDRA